MSGGTGAHPSTPFVAPCSSKHSSTELQFDTRVSLNICSIWTESGAGSGGTYSSLSEGPLDTYGGINSGQRQIELTKLDSQCFVAHTEVGHLACTWRCDSCPKDCVTAQGISALAVCTRERLLCTSSRDSTVRAWRLRLVAVLEMNDLSLRLKTRVGLVSWSNCVSLAIGTEWNRVVSGRTMGTGIRCSDCIR